jgi:hypothetical protein
LGRGICPEKEDRLFNKKTFRMKLNKFSMKKMSTAETSAIRAGSGASSSSGSTTVCTGSDHTSDGTDRD